MLMPTLVRTPVQHVSGVTRTPRLTSSLVLTSQMQDYRSTPRSRSEILRKIIIYVSPMFRVMIEISFRHNTYHSLTILYFLYIFYEFSSWRKNAKIIFDLYVYKTCWHPPKMFRSWRDFFFFFNTSLLNYQENKHVNIVKLYSII